MQFLWKLHVFVNANRLRRRRKSLTVVRCIEDILVEHGVPYVGFIGGDFTFMHNTSHTRRGLNQTEVILERIKQKWTNFYACKFSIGIRQ